MKLKTKKILLVIYIVALAVACILMEVFNDDLLAKIFAGITLFLIFAGAIFAVTVCFVVMRNNRKLLDSLIAQKNFTDAKEIFTEKYKNYMLGWLNITAKFYVLVACVAMDDLESAKELLKERWWAMSIDAQYFETLINLKEGNIELAKTSSAKLMQSKYKAASAYQNVLKRIFTAIDTKNFDDQFYQDSIYPITKDIYDKYNI